MIWSIIKPWALMSISALYIPVTVVKLLAAGDLHTLRSWSAFNDAWFGNFWAFLGPIAKGEAEQYVIPLLAGRIKNGRAVEAGADSGAPIGGTVLEIGAGSGMWTQIIADNLHSEGDSATRAGTKIYGVEPNPMSAAALKRRVDDVGLTGTYEVLPFGIEDLQRETKIGPGSVDCVLTIQCLCSIPEPEKNIQLLYEYLKPGGRWYVYEHVKAEKGAFIPVFQRFTNCFWEFFVGSCHLCRPTSKSILAAGQWESYDLDNLSGESSWEVIPHLVGTLTKAS